MFAAIQFSVKAVRGQCFQFVYPKILSFFKGISRISIICVYNFFNNGKFSIISKIMVIKFEMFFTGKETFNFCRVNPMSVIV